MKDDQHKNEVAAEHNQIEAETARNAAEDDALAIAAGNATDANDPFLYAAQQRAQGARNTHAGSQAALANATATVQAHIDAKASEAEQHGQDQGREVQPSERLHPGPHSEAAANSKSSSALSL